MPKPKRINDKLGFGQFRGTPIFEMNDERQIKYLKWMLGEENLEKEWGDAIREHFGHISVKFKVSNDQKVFKMSNKAIDQYSILFFDNWMKHFTAEIDSGGEPLGIVTFMERELFNVMQGQRLNEGDATIHHNGAVWTFRDSGNTVFLKNIETEEPEPEFDELPYEDDIPF